MKLKARWLRMTLGVVLAASLAACGGGGEEPGAANGEWEKMNIVYASSLPEDSALNAGLQWWASELEKRTDGAITVEAHYSGSLVGAAELLPAVRDGRVDLAYVAAVINPAEWPLWAMSGVPFETSDPAGQMWAYQELYDKNEAYRKEWEKNGVHNMMQLALSPAVTGFKEPVEDVGDLAGRRVRMVGYAAAALNAVGMQTVALDPAELYESIERGVVDGYGAFPFDIVHTQGLHEVAPNMYDLGIGHYSASAYAANLDWWRSLDPKVQDLMTEVAKEYQTEQAIDVVMKAEQAACDAVSKNAKVVVLDKAQQDEIKTRAGTAALDLWLKEATSRGVDEKAATAFHDEFLAAYDKYQGESDYKSGLQACAERS